MTQPNEITKRYWPAAASFPVFAAVMFIADARAAGSNLSDGLGHAMFFAIPAAGLSFVILALIGFSCRWVYERARHKPLPARDALPWFAHLPVTILLLLMSFPDSPHDQFRRYIADDVPASLADLRCWHVRTFNATSAYLSFRIDPAELSKVLGRHAYSKTSWPEGFDVPELQNVLTDPGVPVRLPDEPLVYRYSYIDQSQTPRRYVTHYTTAREDQVVTVFRVD